MIDILFVVGMHRSATSAFAGAATLIGAARPLRMLAGNKSNPKGYFEPEDVVKTNDAVLASERRLWSDCRSFPLPEGPARQAVVTDYARLLKESFEEGSLLVLKDPRVSILAPLWIEAAEQTDMRPCFVLMLRDPAAAAKSIMRRDGISADGAIALWLRYMLDAERNSRGRARSIVIADSFVSDPVVTLNHVGKDLELSWPTAPESVRAELEDFVESGLLQVSNDLDTQHLDLAKAVYAALAALAQAPGNDDLLTELDQLRRVFEARCPDIHDAMVFEQFDKAVKRQWLLRARHDALIDARATTEGLQSRTLELSEQVSRLTGEHTLLKDEHTRLKDEHTRLTDKHTRLTDKHTRLTDEHTRLTDEHTRLTDEHTQLVDEQNAVHKALLEELEATCNRPINTLSNFLKYKAMRISAKASPPLPTRMTERFARSALKRDPKRFQEAYPRKSYSHCGAETKGKLFESATSKPGKAETEFDRTASGTNSCQSPVRFAGKIAKRQGHPVVMLCCHTAAKTLYGAERSLLDIIDALNELDFNVVVTAPNSGNSAYLEALREMSLAVYVFKYGWWRNDVPVDDKVVAAFARIIADEDAEVVHANTIVLREPQIAAQRMGVRSIVHVRELIRHDDALLKLIGLPANVIIDHLWSNFDRLIVNSQMTLREFSLPNRKPLLVNNTVDLEQLTKLSIHPDSIALRVGLISSNLPKKGIWDFTRVAQSMAITHPEIEFCLIGPINEHTEEITAQIAAGQLSGTLKVQGYRETPAAAVAETDIILNLSHFRESFGRTVIEGMAAGRPVIVYDHGAPSEIVSHEETGLIVPFGDTDAVAEAIRNLAADRSRMVEMGRRAREHVTSRFGRAVYKEQMRRAYDGLLGPDVPTPQKLKLPARADVRAQPRSTLKIAYFTWHFPVPSETFVLNELRVLREQGFDVRVFCRQSPNPEFIPDFDISWERVSGPDDLAKRLIETERTIVHSHFVYPTVTDMVWPACEQAEIPFTFIAHAQDIFRYRNDEANRIAEIGRSKWCRKVFVPARFHRQYLAERNVPEGKMMINPNGCEHRLYADGWTKDRKRRPFRRIVAIHRFTEKKGLIHLIRAGKLLEKDNVRIEIYGYGELEAEYQATITEERIKNVSLCGPINGREMMLKLFRESDLFACPSVRAADGDMDGVPTVLMEAMAAGLPVLTTDLSGIPDLVEDGVSGLICEPNPDAIAARVRAYYGLPDAAVAALIETASERIRSEYNVEHLVENLLRVWNRERIDLVIVSWNNFEQLSEVIGRLYKYTSLPFHLVVCDNGSDAPTLAQLMKIYGAHDNVTLILNRKNAYVGPGTNICLAEGHSDYAIYVCGKEGMTTDYGWEKPFVAYMNTHSKVGLAGTLCHSPSYLYGRDYPTAQAQWDKFRNREFALSNPDRSFSHVQGGFFVLRRKMLEEIGGFSDHVPHNSTDVEFSYYVESCGWELGEVPGVMSLYNKTRPGLFHRIDESMHALHPPTLNDLSSLDAIARRAVYHCNVCGEQSDTFVDVDGAAECPRCGAGRRARSIHRVLAESTLLYRRLPALGVNVPAAIEEFWREQFQGDAISATDLSQRLTEERLTDIADARLQLVLLNDILGSTGKEDNALLSEAARVLAPGGTLIIAGSEETAEELSPRLEARGLSGISSKRYSSSVSHYDWLPVLLFMRDGVDVSDI